MSAPEVISLSAPERRRKRGIITMGILGAFAFAIFGLLPKSGEPVTYSFVLGNEWIFVKEWIVNSKTGALGFIFDVIPLLGSGWQVHSVYWITAGSLATFSSTYFWGDGRCAL